MKVYTKLSAILNNADRSNSFLPFFTIKNSVGAIYSKIVHLYALI